jgi:phenylacetate-CoA ligase
VELAPGATDGEAQRAAAARELQHHIKSRVGVSTAVEVTSPFSLERVVVGKARRVFDRRPKE